MAAAKVMRGHSGLPRPEDLPAKLPPRLLDRDEKIRPSHKWLKLPDDRNVLVIHGVMTPEECAAVIRASDEAGMTPASRSVTLRDSDRVILEAGDITDILWERTESIVCAGDSPFASQVLAREDELDFGSGSQGTWKPVGLNSRCRSCRYGPGGHFAPHCDSWVVIPGTERRSLLTFMVYLNDVAAEQGGATRFLRRSHEPVPESMTGQARRRLTEGTDVVTLKLQPEAGMLVVFEQAAVLHDGEVLESGSKSIFRSDVVFAREPGTEAEISSDEERARQSFLLAQEAEAAGHFEKARLCYRKAFKLDPRLDGLMTIA